MGQKRIELLQCEEPISPDQMLDMQDNANQHVNNLVDDVIGEGVVSATLAPTGTGVGVSISGFECWSSSGHGKQTAAVEVDLADYIPVAGYKWVSIFGTPGFESGDLRANAYGANEYHKRTEAVTFSVLEGTATVLPINPGGGAVRVCSIRLSAGMTSLLSGQIQTINSRSDQIVALTGKVSKSGDTLTGTVTYNGRPLARLNSGRFAFPLTPSLISGTGSADFDAHYILSAGGWIDTKIESENLVVLVVPVLGFYRPDGSIAAARVQPITMRMHTDLMAAGSTLTEGIFVIFEEDGNGENTGRFIVVCIGALHYCNRFAGRTVRWTAIAPQPVLGLEG